MTTESQRAAIRKMIVEHTKRYTVSRDVARKSLVESEIYTRKGEVSEAYGGTPSQSKKATR
jgi:hypothetical protein